MRFPVEPAVRTAQRLGPPFLSALLLAHAFCRTSMPSFLVPLGRLARRSPGNSQPKGLRFSWRPIARACVPRDGGGLRRRRRGGLITQRHQTSHPKE